jgi:hypothetical protein
MPEGRRPSTRSVEGGVGEVGEHSPRLRKLRERRGGSGLRLGELKTLLLL